MANVSYVIWMFLKCELKPSNDLLVIHKLLLIDAGVGIVIFNWLQLNHVCAPLTCAVAARLRVRARTRPYSGEQQRIQPRSRERGAHTEQKMDGVGSFGAGRTGSTVDPIAFAKQPQTILRVLSWVSAPRRAAVCV